MKDPNMRKMSPSCPFFALFCRWRITDPCLSTALPFGSRIASRYGEERTSCPRPAL
jgi:hypothetical protein